MRQTLLVLLCLVLTTLPVAAGMPDLHGWSSVASLSPGISVEIQSKENGTVKGAVASVSDTAVVVMLNSGKTVTVNRMSITRVYVTGKNKAILGAVVGAGIGAGVGAGIGGGTCGGLGCTKPQGAGYGALIGAAVGGIIGGVVGLHHGNRALIYDAKS